MGIENLSIRRTASSGGGKCVIATPSASPEGAVLTWTVMKGGSRKWAFNMTVVGTPKGGGEAVTLADGYVTKYSIADSGQAADGYLYSISVDTAMAAVDGTCEYALQAFAARDYDCVSVTFNVRPQEYPAGYTVGGTFYVEYVPELSGVTAQWDGFDALTLSGTMDDFGYDGAFWVAQVWDSDAAECMSAAVKASGSYSGTEWTATLPLSAFTQAPLLWPDSTIDLSMAYVPTYSSIADCAETVTADTVATALTGCTSAAAWNADGSVTFTNAATADIVGVSAKMRGSDYSIDCGSVDGLADVALPMAPTDGATYDVTFLASDHQSQAVEVALPAWGRSVVRVFGGGNLATGTYNVEVEVKDEQDAETRVLAGRALPSAFWGESRTSEWDVSYDLPADGSQLDEVTAARALQSCLCHADVAGMGRFKCMVSDVSAERGDGGIVTVSMTLTEVA